MTKISSHRCNWSSKHYACNISGGSRNVPKQFKSLPLVFSKSLNTCLLNCMLFPQLNHSLLIHVTYQEVQGMPPNKSLPLVSIASLSNTCLLNCMLFLQLNYSLPSEALKICITGSGSWCHNNTHLGCIVMTGRTGV